MQSFYNKYWCFAPFQCENQVKVHIVFSCNFVFLHVKKLQHTSTAGIQSYIECVSHWDVTMTMDSINRDVTAIVGELTRLVWPKSTPRDTWTSKVSILAVKGSLVPLGKYRWEPSILVHELSTEHLHHHHHCQVSPLDWGPHRNGWPESGPWRRDGERFESEPETRTSPGAKQHVEPFPLVWLSKCKAICACCYNSIWPNLHPEREWLK